ncbi:MAG TPA: imidazole glycerol phosphate synthase cyclase subunit [Candidatus Baltobacteraceae bacterium]|jgi:cyclase|nr:imidazole glycerol phosphate synthase cyclase subunit [Candidatus Baltobacteraceae bacterium]
MTAKRIVACLDVRARRVVKGRQFQAIRDAGDPAEYAARYCAGGIDELVLLDISATLEDRAACWATVRDVGRAVNVPLTAGGGVRSLQDIDALLNAGADKVAINSAAVEKPELLSQAANRFGSQCVVLSVDVRRSGAGTYVATRSGVADTAIPAAEWIVRAQELGAGEVLLTSIDRDGTSGGFDLPLIREISNVTRLPVIASGGAAGADSFADALLCGADAALGASVFHYGAMTPAQVKNVCAARGLQVRQ